MLTMDVDFITFGRFRVASVAEPVFYTEDAKKFVLLLALPNFSIRTIVRKTDEITDEMFRLRELHSYTAHRVFAFHGIDDKGKGVSVQASNKVIANPAGNNEEEVDYGITGRWR